MWLKVTKAWEAIRAWALWEQWAVEGTISPDVPCEAAKWLDERASC